MLLLHAETRVDVLVSIWTSRRIKDAVLVLVLGDFNAILDPLRACTRALWWTQGQGRKKGGESAFQNGKGLYDNEKLQRISTQC